MSWHQSEKINIDLTLAGILASAMFVMVLVGFNQVSPYILHDSTWDYWFESDPPGVASQVLDRLGWCHYRTSHHPLSSLLLFPVVNFLQNVFKIRAEASIGLVLASAAAVWVCTVFILLRTLRLRRGDSIIFTGLTASSASVVFWFPIPEIHVFAALSIVLAVAILALSEQGISIPSWIYLLVSAGTLSFTTTNWMVGLLMLFLALPWRKALKIAVATCVLVGLLWGVQKIIFPMSGSPLSLFTERETMYLFNKESLGLLRKLYAFFFHSIILPEIGYAYGFRLSVQGMSPGAGSLLAGVGIAMWSLLFIVGIWSFARLRHSRTGIMLLLAISGQCLLTMVFGVETFFYSTNWGPLLVLFCALSALTQARKLAVVIAASLLVLTAVNNLQKFGIAAAQLQEKYHNEERFTARVAELTDPDSLIICGMEAGAASGSSPIPAGQNPETAPVGYINSKDPEICFFSFDDVQVTRRGWTISYEDWTIKKIEAFRQRGAKYFITPYTYGLVSNPALFKAMDLRFRKLERTPKLAFYDLSSQSTIDTAEHSVTDKRSEKRGRKSK